MAEEQPNFRTATITQVEYVKNRPFIILTLTDSGTGEVRKYRLLVEQVDEV